MRHNQENQRNRQLLATAQALFPEMAEDAFYSVLTAGSYSRYEYSDKRANFFDALTAYLFGAQDSFDFNICAAASDIRLTYCHLRKRFRRKWELCPPAALLEDVGIEIGILKFSQFLSFVLSRKGHAKNRAAITSIEVIQTGVADLPNQLACRINFTHKRERIRLTFGQWDIVDTRADKSAYRAIGADEISLASSRFQKIRPDDESSAVTTSSVYNFRPNLIPDNQSRGICSKP